MTATTPDTAAEAAVAVGVPSLAARSEPPETGVPAERVAEIMCEEFRELPFPPHPIDVEYARSTLRS